MKRSPLKSKTALKRKAPLKSSSSLKRSSFKAHSSPTPTLGAGKKDSKNKLARKGLSGIGRTADEELFHGRVAALGCLACRLLEEQQVYPTRVHHTDGRKQSKSDLVTERKVIPLCDKHHDPTQMLHKHLDDPSVHGNKKAFNALVGTESWCVLHVHKLIQEQPLWLTGEEWADFCAIQDQKADINFILEKKLA